MLEAKYKIDLISGGNYFHTWYSAAAVYKLDGGGIQFTDLVTCKKITVTGTIIVSEL